jgi:hypothetical protein
MKGDFCGMFIVSKCSVIVNNYFIVILYRNFITILYKIYTLFVPFLYTESVLNLYTENVLKPLYIFCPINKIKKEIYKDMAYTQEQIEWLWRNGKMPDWAYFQQNGKTAQENYVLATERAKQRILDNYNR